MIAYFIFVVLYLTKMSKACNPQPEINQGCGSSGAVQLVPGQSVPITMTQSGRMKECVWMFDVKSNLCKPELTCSTFNMVVSQGCRSDFLEVLDGNVYVISFILEEHFKYNNNDYL